ncbi:beta strand repeat-containing protein, partial [Dapis sp. BLCC M126]
EQQGRQPGPGGQDEQPGGPGEQQGRQPGPGGQDEQPGGLGGQPGGPGERQDGQPGNSDIDILEGGAGADLFILGSGQIYYDDNGTADYALIRTFSSVEGDQIQLYGSSSDYTLEENVSGLPAGTAIYTNNGSELIAVVDGVTGMNASGSEFSFV